MSITISGLYQNNTHRTKPFVRPSPKEHDMAASEPNVESESVVAEISDEAKTLYSDTDELRKGKLTELHDTLKKTAMDKDGKTETRSGKVGVNAGKLARMLAAAKTKAQVRAVIAKIQQDIKECEAGKAQGMDVDEASVRAAKSILSQAKQRLGEAASREATPEEEMAFSLAGLM